MHNKIRILHKIRWKNNYTSLNYKDFGINTDNNNVDIVWPGSINFNKYKTIKIKKESVSIAIEEKRAYESEYECMAIDEMSIFFLIPESRYKANVNYFMKNKNLVDNAYFLHFWEWLDENSNSPHLTYLGIILDEIYLLTKDILSSIEYNVKIDDKYLLDTVAEVKKLVKKSFFDQFYGDTVDLILRHDSRKVLRDLYPDEYEKYEKMDMWELYETNEDFRKEIDKLVQEELEQMWSTDPDEQNITENVKQAIKSKIKAAWMGKKYRPEKMVVIMYHKKLLSLMYVEGHINESIEISIRIAKINNSEYNDKFITLHYLAFIISKPQHAINCSFGFFNILNRLRVLTGVMHDPRFDDYNDLYYIGINKILSIKARYDTGHVFIEDLTFDFLKPNKDFSSFKIKQQITLRLEPKQMQSLLQNGNQLFSMLIRSSLFVIKMYSKLFNDFDMKRTLVMAQGILFPNEYSRTL